MQGYVFSGDDGDSDTSSILISKMNTRISS